MSLLESRSGKASRGVFEAAHHIAESSALYSYGALAREFGLEWEGTGSRSRARKPPWRPAAGNTSRLRISAAVPAEVSLRVPWFCLIVCPTNAHTAR